MCMCLLKCCYESKKIYEIISYISIPCKKWLATQRTLNNLNIQHLSININVVNFQPTLIFVHCNVNCFLTKTNNICLKKCKTCFSAFQPYVNVLIACAIFLFHSWKLYHFCFHFLYYWMCRNLKAFN